MDDQNIVRVTRSYYHHHLTFTPELTMDVAV